MGPVSIDAHLNMCYVPYILAFALPSRAQQSPCTIQTHELCTPRELPEIWLARGWLLLTNQKGKILVFPSQLSWSGCQWKEPWSSGGSGHQPNDASQAGCCPDAETDQGGQASWPRPGCHCSMLGFFSISSLGERNPFVFHTSSSMEHYAETSTYLASQKVYTRHIA